MARKNNNQKLNQFHILPTNITDAIIYSDNVQEAIMNAQKEKILSEIHPYKITEPKSENGRWQTYYKDAKGERKIICALICFRNGWNTRKQLPIVLIRHTQHYRRYFEQSELHNKPVRRIDTLLLESECNRLVKEYSMTRKEWNNVKTILIGCFEYAVRKKYIADNPMDDVKILVKYRQTSCLVCGLVNWSL